MAVTAVSKEGGGTGWAAIARKEAAVSPALDIPALLSSAGLRTVVVDANAIIGGGVRLPGLADQFFTIKEVLQEVRDPASRFHLATLPVSIRCLEPSEEALAKVVQFSRATGDLQSLSEVDLKLIALTYTLEAQVHGTDHLRARPPPLLVTPTSTQRAKDPPGWGTVANPEEWEGIEEEADGAKSESHILGLKSLTLDAVESNGSGEIVVDSESGATGGNEELRPTGFSEISADASNSEETGPIGGEHVASTVNGSSAELSTDVGGEVAKIQAAQENGHVWKKDGSRLYAGPRKQNKAKPAPNLEGKNVAAGLDASKGELDDGGDDWERALSRSTKRNYLKRSLRRAARKAAEPEHLDEAGQEVKEEQKAVESIVTPPSHMTTKGTEFFRPDLNSGAETDTVEEPVADGGCCSGHDDELMELRDLDQGEESSRATCGEDGVEKLEVHSNFDDTESNGDVASSSHFGGVESEQSWAVGPLWTSTIACMTGDFAMQNVLLQMGLRLLSTSGMHIRELNKWILKCQACGQTTSEIGRIFCPKCGNGGTLFKVSVTIGPNGSVHAGRNRRQNLRGTRYSLPLPKGGRDGAIQNPILREDQLPNKPKAKKPVEMEALSSADVVFTVAHGHKGHKGVGVKTAAAIYGGRRNPNERRKIAK